MIRRSIILRTKIVSTQNSSLPDYCFSLLLRLFVSHVSMVKIPHNNELPSIFFQLYLQRDPVDTLTLPAVEGFIPWKRAFLFCPPSLLPSLSPPLPLPSSLPPSLLSTSRELTVQPLLAPNC